MKVYKQEEINEIKENFEWLRKQEHFNTSDAGRVANMSSKYLGKTVNCMSCGGGLWKAKWDLVGWFSGVLAAVDAGNILIEEDIFKAVEEAEASKTEEEVILDVTIDAAPADATPAVVFTTPNTAVETATVEEFNTAPSIVLKAPAPATVVEKAKNEIKNYSKKNRGFKL